MMTRLIFFMLAILLIVSPVSAGETTLTGLKALYDDYHYSITVEWDQKDKEFAKQLEAKFKMGLVDLQKEGLSNEELISFASSQVGNEKAKLDFDNLMNSVKLNSMSSTEVNRLVNEVVKKSYQQGANWNGDTATNIIIGLSIAAAIALVVGLVVSCAVDPKCDDSTGPDGVDDNSTWENDDDWYDDGCYYDSEGTWGDC